MRFLPYILAVFVCSVCLCGCKEHPPPPTEQGEILLEMRDVAADAVVVLRDVRDLESACVALPRLREMAGRLVELNARLRDLPPLSWKRNKREILAVMHTALTQAALVRQSRRLRKLPAVFERLRKVVVVLLLESDRSRVLLEKLHDRTSA